MASAASALPASITARNRGRKIIGTGAFLLRRLVQHFSYPMPRKERANIAARARQNDAERVTGRNFGYGVGYQRNP
jgi:hypothetical protein